ncbi:hypothetical protein ACFL6I_12645 [candidate division KSB1 bacterium]
MEKKRLFNWEVEKKIKELESQIKFKEASLEELHTFILETNYYNGDSDSVYVLLCNTYHFKGYMSEADEIFGKLFEMWKVVSNKFPQNIQKLRHLVDLIISKMEYVPLQFIEHILKQSKEEIIAISGYAIDRFVEYDKANLLNDFTEQIPYEGSDSQTLFKLINTAVELGSGKVDEYLSRALESMKDPIAFLNNIKFSAELFNAISPETLKKILDLPGINTKFHHFIKFESFMESLDKIPSLTAKFFIDISNRLYEKNTAMAIQYALRAIRKPDFLIDENLKEIKCACDKEPSDKPSVAELLMLTTLKEGDFAKIWKIVENSYFVNAHSVNQFDEALKYTGAAVKLSGANSDLIAKHIMFLSRRIRSVDGPEGIIEGDRYKYKEENVKYNQQIEAYRALYQKKTGKKFLI